MLDSFDRKILDCLQDNADMPLAEVAERVGLSTTPCWRRIKRLQDNGVVRARVALLNRKAVNAGVTVFVAVRSVPTVSNPSPVTRERPLLTLALSLAATQVKSRFQNSPSV